MRYQPLCRAGPQHRLREDISVRDRRSSVLADCQRDEIENHDGPDFEHWSKGVTPKPRDQNRTDESICDGDYQRSVQAVATRWPIEDGEADEKVGGRAGDDSKRGQRLRDTT